MSISIELITCNLGICGIIIRYRMDGFVQDTRTGWMPARF